MIKGFAIIPNKRKLPNAKAFKDAVSKALGEVAEEAKREYKKTIWGWRNKPTFHSVQVHSGHEWSVFVYPYGKNAQQYLYVDLGTRPHSITPKNAKQLVFLRGYKARTTPGVIASGYAKRFPPLWRVMEVRQSIEPRHFSETIAKSMSHRFSGIAIRYIEDTARTFQE